MKAGCVASGEFMTERAVKRNSAYLVIVADDASENTKKKFRNMCSYRKVPLSFYSNKIVLGNALGKNFRASLAITDRGLATMICENLKLEVSEHGENEDL
jgi:ribosomal protein L7Ae-like RNA K-turn-binding protein